MLKVPGKNIQVAIHSSVYGKQDSANVESVHHFIHKLHRFKHL